MQSRISPNGRFRLGVCKKTSVFRCLTQKGAGAHRHTSNLYDELLADIYFVLNECEARPHPDSKIRSFDRDIESKLKITSLEVDRACDASSSMSLDASSKWRWCSRTHVRPNSTTNCWQIWYFVLIEREARPHPDRTPVTSPLSPPSPYASLASRRAMAWHCVV